MVVLINGEATKTFHCERGLRQGCPLSPLLFIFILEGLNILLNNKQAEGHLKGIKIAGLTYILHILFVDDVLILSNANMVEWTTIHSLLISFCDVSGLEINVHKSVFLVSNVHEPLISDLKELFGISSLELSKGFSYLGHFLKSDCYTKHDWNWLVKRFEGRILNWHNRFLYMGGRYVQIKVVLESIPVFWMSLVHIPATILTSLRQLMFSFLWTGSKKNKGVHLSKWEVLSKPKMMGGWGLKNMPLFYKAIMANTMWRILTKPGLWNRVITAKYLRHIPVHLWIRFASDSQTKGSRTWRNLLSTIPILL
jgi:hypothetical protein